MALRIGLTGGIGSGKSTVAQLLVGAGAALVDTDAIARTLTGAGGAAMPALRAEFGGDMVTADGALCRDSMRQRVFSQPAAKLRLEAILHPMIGSESARQAAAAAAAGQPVVFDVPLLAESQHWRARVDKVLVVDCAESTQLARVVQRPGWDLAIAQRVLDQQAPRRARRAIADAVIYNDGIGLAQLAAEVDGLWLAWRPAG